MKNVRAFFEELESEFCLADVGNARFVAMDLLAHIFGESRSWVLLNGAVELSAERELLVVSLAERVKGGEPIQYVIGEVDFRDITLKSDARALIPRSETELLVGEVLAVAGFESPRVVDVGTGTGCIILSLARELDGAFFGAGMFRLMLCRRPRRIALRNGVLEKLNGGIRACLMVSGRSRQILLVSNPPYIDSAVVVGWIVLFVILSRCLRLTVALMVWSCIGF